MPLEYFDCRSVVRVPRMNFLVVSRGRQQELSGENAIVRMGFSQSEEVFLAA